MPRSFTYREWPTLGPMSGVASPPGGTDMRSGQPGGGVDINLPHGGPIDAMGRAARDGNFVAVSNRWSASDAPAERPRPAPGQALSRSLVALDQNSTIIAVIELSQSSWLVAGMLPGIERQPRKKLEPSPERLLAVLHRWRDEAVRAGRALTRIAVAFEAGRDGFWLARWLEARGVEAHVS